MSSSLLISYFRSIHQQSHYLFKPIRSVVVSNRTMSEALSGDFDTANKPQGLLAILEKNPKRLQRIKFLGNLFGSAGYELRIAGGAVRDILRGVEPQDIDFATTAEPDQSLAILKRHEDLLRIIVTASGQKHGTVAVKFKETPIDLKKIKLNPDLNRQEDNLEHSTKSSDKPEYDEESPYEITTLRCDYFTDGRHAEVKFINDWRQDAERRDLTINAMFLTLDDGKLIDYFDGESDLKKGIVRFVGNADLRIQEDYLRILRFFRFWSRYGRHNQPDSDTLAVIKSNLSGLDQISGERIWVEIKKIFGALPCLEVVGLMLELRMLDHIGFEKVDDGDHEIILKDLQTVQANVEQYIVTYNNPSEVTLNKISLKKIKDLLPSILFSTAIRTTETCLATHKRMKFSNIERDTILYIVENREELPHINRMKYQLAVTHHPERPHILQKMRALLIYKGEFEYLEQLESWHIPNFPLTGQIVSREIKKRKLPGSLIKVVLESLKNEWAASDYKLTVTELEEKIPAKIDELSDVK